jgi:hypothetical protein
MKKSLIIILLSLPFLSSCLNVVVYSDYDHGIDFTKYKTFAWLPHSDSARNIIYDNQIIESNLIQYVNQHLGGIGYNLDVNEPDLLVNYHLVVQQRQTTVSSPVYGGNQNNNYFYNNNRYYNNYNGNYNNNYNYNNNNNYNRPYSYNSVPYIIGYNTRLVVYDEGTLIIDIIDRKTNRMIWRGWGVSTLTSEPNLENTLPKEITKIFKTYPIQPPKQPGEYQDH